MPHDAYNRIHLNCPSSYFSAVVSTSESAVSLLRRFYRGYLGASLLDSRCQPHDISRHNPNGTSQNDSDRERIFHPGCRNHFPEMSSLMKFGESLLQPWKLVTLGIGLGLLVAGSFHYDFADWDVGISLLMGVMAYVFAPWSVRALVRKEWRKLPLILFLYWLTVDGVYVGYNELLGRWYVREANFYATSCLYWLCGFVWLHRGPFRDVLPR